MVKSRPDQQKRAVIVGLDGVPYSLLKHYMDLGVMPKFHDMVAAGALLPMLSTLPEVSSVAWSSFLTGKNPAAHGIFGFMEIDSHSYQYRFTNFLSLKTPTFWEDWQLPVVAINIPQTYPAKPTNGVMVSGFVAVDMAKAVYPKRVYDYLKALDYRLDVNCQGAAQNPEAFFQDMFYTFEKRQEAIRHLFDREEWQIFIGTITETDRLHHFFYNSAYAGTYHEIFLRFYQQLDNFIYELFTRALQEGALFLTCSDHGFTQVESEVYVNRYLMNQGVLKTRGGDGLTGITDDSLAFCLDPARVYIHRKEKYARGPVSPEGYEPLRQELTRLFESLSYEGRKVVREVFLKHDIFAGPFLDQAPDLYVLGEPGFDLKSSLRKEAVFGMSHFTGAHTYEDAHLFICNGPTSWNEVISIDKIAQLIKMELSS